MRTALVIVFVLLASVGAMKRNTGPGVSSAHVPSASSIEFPPTAVIPFAYPLYKQCDPIWALDFMGGSMMHVFWIFFVKLIDP